MALIEQSDHANWGVLTVCEKWASDDAFRRGEIPYEVIERKGNLLLNAGITRLLNLLTGAGGNAYDLTHSRIGVGDGVTAAAAANTGLAGSNTYFKLIDAAFPTVTAQTATWKATYGAGVANFAWAEWGVDNGTADASNPVASTMLNRKVEALGTKSGGTWVLTITITVS